MDPTVQPVARAVAASVAVAHGSARRPDRSGVTVAAGTLQRRNLIAYDRGEMKIVDRVGLEHAACSCHASDQAAYADQFE
jgi:hypothetical protein